MKKRKYLFLVIAVLLMGIGSFITYSIYRKAFSGNGTVTASAWSVKVKKGSTEVQNLNFGIDDVTWTTHNGKNGKIAPGDNGYIDFTIDASGSQVDVAYTAEVNTITNSPSSEFNVMINDYDGVIPYATGAGNMTKTIRIDIVWKGAISDDSTKDSSDMSASNKTLTIPVSLTVKQSSYTVGYAVSATEGREGYAIPSGIDIRNTSSLAMADWETVTGTTGASFPFYIKYYISNNTIQETYLDFVIDDAKANQFAGVVPGTYTLKAGDASFFNRNVAIVKYAFDYDNHPGRCTDSGDRIICGVSGVGATVNDNGSITVFNHGADGACFYSLGFTGCHN